MELLDKIIKEYSGKRSNNFRISEKTETLIDNYITNCQVGNYNEQQLKENYNELLAQIIINENDKTLPTKGFKHDVDVLFKDKETDIIYYLEIKYNDDHDTGKFVDINRKLLKTYTYLVRELNIDNKQKFKPLLVYFTNKRKNGNIYIPEDEAIYRGKRFFETFTPIKYDELEKYMKNIGENYETIKMFNDMYNTVMERQEYKYDKNIDITCIHENNQ